MKKFLILILMFGRVCYGFSAPVDISSAGSDALAPNIGIDPSGNAVAVWFNFNSPSNDTIQAAIYNGVSWAGPSTNSAVANNTFIPGIGVYATANAVANWQRFDGTNTIVQASTLTSGTWSFPVDISTAGQNAFFHQIAVDPAGDAVAVWSRFDGTSNIIQAATKPFGGSWSAPVNVSTVGQNGILPRIGVDGSGNAVVVWQNFSLGNEVIQAAVMMTFGGSWSSPVTISSLVGGDALLPHVAVNASGSAIAVWTQFDGNFYVIQSATLPTLSGSWASPTTISVTGQHAFNPKVAIATSGNGVAVWERSDGMKDRVESASFVSGSWTSPVTLSAAGEDAVTPQVAIASTSGNAIAVWDRYDGTNDIIEAATLPFGGSWTSPVDLSAVGGDAVIPQVAVNSSGAAVVVWHRYNGTNHVVEAVTGSI